MIPNFIEQGRVFIIAEAGVNHNQNLANALQMIDAAAAAGADAVKFQTFKPEQVVHEDIEMAEYQKKNTRSQQTQQQLLAKVQLPESFYPDLIQRAQERNIIFLSTPHGGKASVDFLEQFNLPAYKVGSGDLTNYILLDHIVKTKKTIILSTGVSYLKEVVQTVQRIKSRGKNHIIVLHCTTNYPCPPEEINLQAMKTLKEALNVPVGFSDHSQGNEAAIAAVALGMAVYEFHFTLDKTLPGPDHIASLEPQEMGGRISAIRKTEILMGSKEKAPTGFVKTSMRPLISRSIVASRNLNMGTIISNTDLEALRPDTGLSPMLYETLLGKKLKRTIKKYSQIHLEDVE